MQNTNPNNNNSSSQNTSDNRQRQGNQYQSVKLPPLQYQFNTHESIVLPSQQPKRGRGEHFNSQFQQNIISRPILLLSSRDINTTTSTTNIPIALPSSTNSNSQITSSSNSRMFSPNPVSPLYPVVTTPSSALSPPQHHHQHQQQSHKKFKTSNSGPNTPVTGSGIGSPSTVSYLANSANISYTRSQPLKDNNQTASTTTTNNNNNNTTIENEDQKFFRLAKEALVATAKGVKTSHSNNKFGNTFKIGMDHSENNQSDGNETVVDSTIEDLLRRLQYASAPHGNPIGQISARQTNSKGLLDVQNEYSNFPDLHNNNFFRNSVTTTTTDSKVKNNSKFSSNHHHPSGNEPGWSFLIDEPSTKATSSVVSNTTPSTITTNIIPESESKLKRESSITSIINPSTTTDINSTTNNDSKKTSTKNRKYSQDPTRKFPCDKCPMSFRRSSDLKRHEKQHLTIPPNICQFCGKGFARKDALKRHIGTLTCKRNADKKLYIDNLNYLNNPSQDEEEEEEDEDEDDDGEGRLCKKRRKSNQTIKEERDDDEEEDDDDEDEVKREFPTYGYQQN